jgi:hypothetical protein
MRGGGYRPTHGRVSVKAIDLIDCPLTLILEPTHAETRLRMAEAQRGKPIWETWVDRAGPVKLLKRADYGQTAFGWGGSNGP